MFFADTCALDAAGVVAVQEYGSSPCRAQRLVSAKTTALLGWNDVDGEGAAVASRARGL